MRFKIITCIILLLNVVCLLGIEEAGIPIASDRMIKNVIASENYYTVISTDKGDKNKEAYIYSHNGDHLYSIPMKSDYIYFAESENRLLCVSYDYKKETTTLEGRDLSTGMLIWQNSTGGEFIISPDEKYAISICAVSGSYRPELKNKIFKLADGIEIPFPENYQIPEILIVDWYDPETIVFIAEERVPELESYRNIKKEINASKERIHRFEKILGISHSDTTGEKQKVNTRRIKKRPGALRPENVDGPPKAMIPKSQQEYFKNMIRDLQIYQDSLQRQLEEIKIDSRSLQNPTVLVRYNVNNRTIVAQRYLSDITQNKWTIKNSGKLFVTKSKSILLNMVNTVNHNSEIILLNADLQVIYGNNYSESVNQIFPFSEKGDMKYLMWVNTDDSQAKVFYPESNEVDRLALYIEEKNLDVSPESFTRQVLYHAKFYPNRQGHRIVPYSLNDDKTMIYFQEADNE
jgi:hypothetical protein